MNKRYRVEYFHWEVDPKTGKEKKVPLGAREIHWSEDSGMSREALAFRRATPDQLEKATILKFWELK